MSQQKMDSVMFRNGPLKIIYVKWDIGGLRVSIYDRVWTPYMRVSILQGKAL